VARIFIEFERFVKKKYVAFRVGDTSLFFGAKPPRGLCEQARTDQGFSSGKNPLRAALLPLKSLHRFVATRLFCLGKFPEGETDRLLL
jgi:hypothetical protein